jgi:hypothetical protein
MFEPTRTFEIDSLTLQTLEVIESSNDDTARQQAISRLGSIDDMESPRILIGLWDRILWRSSKKDIIRALGSAGGTRSVQFLIRIAGDTQDLAMASEAILALGTTNDGLAGEFLLNHLIGSAHPLKKELVIALGNMPLFPCDRELRTLLSGNAMSESTIQHLILALSHKGGRESWPEIRARLEQDLTTMPDSELCAIFLAAGRIGNISDIGFLDGLDTQLRFLAHQIKFDAIETLARRAKYSAEDALTDAMSAPTIPLRDAALNALRHFPVAGTRKIFDLLASDFSLDFQCLVRSVLVHDDYFEQDLQFIISHAATIPIEYIAVLIRSYQHLGTARNSLEPLWASLPTNQSLSLLESVRDLDAATRMRKLMDCADIMLAEKVSLINALVSQATMCETGSAPWKEIADCLLDWMYKNPVIEVKERALRALGQIRYEDASLMQHLAKLLKERKFDSTTIYSTLGQIGSENAVRILLRRLKTIANNVTYEGEVSSIIHALSHVGKFPDSDSLTALSAKIQESCKRELLIILAHNYSPGFEDLVTSALDCSDYEFNLLGLAAAKYSHSNEIWAKLFKFLMSKNYSLSIRSLDSIAIGGGMSEHRQLLDWLSLNTVHRSMVEKALKSLTPEPGQPYSSVINRLDRLIEERKGAFDDKEIQSLANKLRERLISSMRVIRTPLVEISDVKRHDLDVALGSKLGHFEKYSEVIKAVLRNAELTWEHPELFNEQVDKSTIVIEFTKSIDLLMQDKIGHFLFAQNDPTSTMQLQSRVILLGLEDKSTRAEQRIRDLQCSQSFESEDFPEHKLRALGTSILTGKLFHDKYQVLDGLRAWSLILLIFGRTFKFSGQLLKPIIPILDCPTERINKISAQMNLLQEARNRAAHRGTLLLQNQIATVRDHCYGVLNELSEIFP